MSEMSVLAFELRSGMAHFRRPDTLGTHASYPFITRTALHGLIASILGLESLPESPRCGIRLLRPVRTVAHEMSMLGKGWVGGGSDFNRPTAIELVVNPHYRVYYQGSFTRGTGKPTPRRTQPLSHISGKCILFDISCFLCRLSRYRS